MPNWVLTNAIVTGSGPNLQKFLDRFREPDGGIDFKLDKVIPMPKELNEDESTFSQTGAIYVWLTEHPGEIPPAGLLAAKCGYSSFAEICEGCKTHFEGANKSTQQQMLKEGRKGLDSCIKYGAFSWYDWCCNYWGTKWEINDEAYVQEPMNPDAEEDSVFLSFQTAWSFPGPIFAELSRLYPELKFSGEYADEDYGSNCAAFTVINGEVVYDDKEGDQAFAYNVWGEEPETDGEYLDNDKEGNED